MESQHIEELKKNGYNLNFDEVFSKAFDIWKKALLPSVATMLIMIIGILIMVWGGVMLYGGGEDILEVIGNNPEKIQIFLTQPETILSISLVSLVLYIFINPLLGGLLKVMNQKDKGENPGFGVLFSCYSAHYFFQIAIYTLISMGIATIVSVACSYLPAGDILNNIFSMIWLVLTTFALPLIVLSNTSGIQGFTDSISLSSKNFFLILGLWIVTMLLIMVGCLLSILTLGIGMLFVIPFVFAMQYAIYAETVGIDTYTEIDQIGNSFNN